jgi:hypothetical protein
MLPIASDQQATTDLLVAIAEICHRHGAHWHPDLLVEVSGGAMRLLAPPGAEGELITMPTELLVPIAEAQWAESTEQLQLLAPPDGASAVQKELLQLHAELYNCTNKMRWWRHQHPARLVETAQPVADALALLKPAPRQQGAATSPVEGFLATRSFGWNSQPDQNNCELGFPDSVDSDQGSAGLNVQATAVRCS